MKKFSEYTHSLSLPINLNLVKINPLRGTALFVLDPKLVFAIVDNFFGGVGRHAKIEGREFTRHRDARGPHAAARRLHRHEGSLDADRQASTSNTCNSEINPNFASIVTPSEVVVVCPFQIELDGGGGALHIVLPYSMIEPLREVLDSGVQSDRAEQDERWLASLKDCLQDAEVELTTDARQRQHHAVAAGGAASPATCCPAISPARPRCSPRACRCSAAPSACRAASNACATNSASAGPARAPWTRRCCVETS